MGSLLGISVGADVEVVFRVSCVTVAPIVELSDCIMVMKGPPLSTGKAFFSCCERSSPDRDELSYSIVIVILYSKVSSLLIVFLQRQVTYVIVRVMLITVALVCLDPSAVSRVISRGGKEISTKLGYTDGDVLGCSL